MVSTNLSFVEESSQNVIELTVTSISDDVIFHVMHKMARSKYINKHYSIIKKCNCEKDSVYMLLGKYKKLLGIFIVMKDC